MVITRTILTFILILTLALSVIACAFSPIGTMAMDHMHEVAAKVQHIQHAQSLLAVSIPTTSVSLLFFIVLSFLFFVINIILSEKHALYFVSCESPPRYSREVKWQSSNPRSPPRY